MKTQSAKSKGRRLQQRVAAALQAVLKLSPKDVFSTPMGTQGEDVKLSEAAREHFPFAIECKNTEKINIWASLEQAESENRDGRPLVVFSRNRSDDYCALKFSDLLMLLLQIKTLKEDNQVLGDGAV